MNDSLLKGEYKDAYTGIVMYLSVSNLPSYFRSEVCEDIEDLLNSAQNDGVDVRNIIGDNIEEFCREIIKAKKFKNQIVFNIIKGMNWALFMSATYSLLSYLVDIQMTLNLVTMFIIDSIIIRFIFSRGLRKAIIKGKGSMKKIINVVIVYSLFVLVVAIINYFILISYVVVIDQIYTFIVLVIMMLGNYLTYRFFKGKDATIFQLWL
ncbi:DUF1048 domain-containing protein [Clostridium sp. YIM B02506]|uniref:DUF1048 domain-containing protein n=1 Tax=Clostridium sp. YIM B02506 TaxID=2910680 RepID=UPI001EEE2126|nr:DUF1048 domain-containing protein [Clostridium sp. YIM B02506]